MTIPQQRLSIAPAGVTSRWRRYCRIPLLSPNGRKAYRAAKWPMIGGTMLISRRILCRIGYTLLNANQWLVPADRRA